MGSEEILYFEESTWDAEVLASPMPVLTVYSANWCSACTRFRPTVMTLSEKFQGRVKVGLVDSDTERSLLRRYLVNALPTTLLFHLGLEVARLVGARDEGLVSELIYRHTGILDADALSEWYLQGD